MKLIDLDEFLRQNCIDRMDGKSCEECKYHVLEVSCERLMEQPTIDAVPMVRCRDCRWWERDYQSRYHSDERPCNIVGMGTSPEWFCADGERREDG